MENLCNSTLAFSELVVDYKKGKTDIKGVPQDNLKDRLVSAVLGWALFLFLPYFIFMGILYFILNQFGIHIDSNWVIHPLAYILIILTSLHLNRNLDSKLKKWLIIKSGQKKRNRIKLTKFKDKEFVIYDTKNVVVEFKAEGDVSKKLNKIWIKQEHPSSMIGGQADIGDMLFLNNEPVWNVHFLFDDVPKNGSLYVEWI